MATDERKDGFEGWMQCYRTNGGILEANYVWTTPDLRAAYHARDAELADAKAEIERLTISLASEMVISKARKTITLNLEQRVAELEESLKGTFRYKRIGKMPPIKYDIDEDD